MWATRPGVHKQREHKVNDYSDRAKGLAGSETRFPGSGRIYIVLKDDSSNDDAAPLERALAAIGQLRRVAEEQAVAQAGRQRV